MARRRRSASEWAELIRELKRSGPPNGYAPAARAAGKIPRLRSLRSSAGAHSGTPWRTASTGPLPSPGSPSSPRHLAAQRRLNATRSGPLRSQALVRPPSFVLPICAALTRLDPHRKSSNSAVIISLNPFTQDRELSGTPGEPAESPSTLS